MVHENWNKSGNVQEPEGQLVDGVLQDMHHLKLISKAPSTRAINKYNSIATDNYSYDNLSYIPDEYNENYKPSLSSISIVNSYESSSANDLTERGVINIRNGEFDYPTLRSSISLGGKSETESRKDEQGSTAKLLSSKSPASCRSWFTYAETVLCTISLAAGLGNLYRLPQTALIRGGLPFLVAYIILSLLIGLPLLFLELGLGQLAQEGFTKTWRAVPLFRGVGYIKFTALCMVSVYYPLHMVLFVYYIIWLGKGPPPFAECASVKITDIGYKAEGIPAQECLEKTFLESPFIDPKWYGVYTGILFLIWVVTSILLIGRTKSYAKSLAILLIPCVGCLISLLVKSIEMESNFKSLEKLTKNSDWTLLSSADVWYYATIQVFFSTNIGFGSFVTNAGIIFSKVNVFWTSIGYLFINLIFGCIFFLIFFILSGELDPLKKTGDVAELHLLSLIYDIGSKYANLDAQIWSIVAYSMLLFSGFISLITQVYTLLKAINVEAKQKWLWWQSTLLLVFMGFIFGAALILPSNIALIHLLDHYVVGNLILISVILEVFAIVAFYGSKRIQLDFEFILGKGLSCLWIGFWWMIPFVLISIFTWALLTLPLTGIWVKDPLWLYGTGWIIVIIFFLLMIITASFQICKQDEYYTFTDKMVAVTKPLRKWGPVDPIMRYSWVQWHSKAKNGERDFTLKRRGTRDYTHSVKKSREPYLKQYIPTISDSSTLSQESPKIYRRNDHNQNNIKNNNTSLNYVEPVQILINNSYHSPHSSQYSRSLRVTSLVDALDPPNIYNSYSNRSSYPSSGYKTHANPLPLFTDVDNDSFISEHYGTFRKGPYVVPDKRIEHVCHRKYSESEISTAL